MIVDDEVEIVELIGLILGGDGHEVFGAYDGREALELVRRERPELVITDLMMPGMDGNELCRAIKSDPELSGTSVLLMSAMYKLSLRECDEDGYIPKPFGVTGMREMVNRLLSDSQ